MFEYKYEVVDESGSSFGCFKAEAAAKIFANAMNKTFNDTHKFIVQEIL
jgi:hypothetical protein